MPSGSNEEFKQKQFKSKGSEPNSENLVVRVPPSMIDALNQKGNKAEFVREAIKEKLAKEREEDENKK